MFGSQSRPGMRGTSSLNLGSLGGSVLGTDPDVEHVIETVTAPAPVVQTAPAPVAPAGMSNTKKALIAAGVLAAAYYFLKRK